MEMPTVTPSKRPGPATATGLVWDIADRLSLELGRMAGRKEVMNEVRRMGGEAGTASTQYWHWKQSYVPPSGMAEEASVIGETAVLQMGRDGRVLVPQALRMAMGLEEGAKLTARIENGELRMVPQKLAIARLQTLVKVQDKGKGSAVDELLAARRKDASR
jgi:bifunctional DNA-binding transcriptional regulator/antitoxin component of YhaV-PrlF toxin-antitoxin module